MSVSQRPLLARFRGLWIGLALLLSGVGSSADRIAVSGLGIEQRVACEQSIQEVYYSHRSWPQDSAKPPFDAAISRQQIEAKVWATEDKSRLLEQRWGSRISIAELQAEIDRMATRSRRPDRLGELWAALGNDPLLIAECLARPLLVERKIRSFYQGDQDIHGALRQKAESELRAAAGSLGLDTRSLSGQVERFQLLRASGKRGSNADLPSGQVLEDADFDARAVQLGVNGEPAALDKDGIALLQEDDEAFWIEAALDAGPDHIDGVLVRWPKQPFAEWLAEARMALGPLQPVQQTSVESRDFLLPKLGAAGCTDDTWSLIEPEGRKGHTAIWTGSEMIVWGGRGDEGLLRSGGRYDPVTDTWASVETSGAPSTRERHTAVWTGARMIIWGGMIDLVAVPEGHSYDPVNDSWSPLSNVGAPAARWDHTAVWAEEELVMLVWGGITGCGGFSCNETGTGGAYDPLTNSWSSLPTGPSARFEHTANWTAAGMMVWGGRSTFGGFVGNGSVLQKSGSDWVWTDLPDADAPAPRAGHTAVWTGLQLIIWGGRDASGPRADGARFAIFGWLPITEVDGPPGLVGHTATWVGSEMVVWGGEKANGVLNSTAYQYDLAGSGDSWVVASGFTTGRRDHTAVWTGSRLLVWGGEAKDQFASRALEHGFIYDPATRGNVLMGMDGHLRPAARSGHSAVWTGSEMIVWGGSPGFVSRTATGSRYDPATDTWMPIESAGAPGARNLPAAIWTGEHMIVWGGRWPGTGGGRYDPVSDSWSGISSFGAPSDRSDHTVIWTGSQMIVWGGRSHAPATTLGNGAAYTPATNQWASLPGSGAPSPRQQHSAIWTGGAMIVWGGTSGTETDSPLLGDGARYVPGSGWSAVASTAPRRMHSAAWTGSEMLVYGDGDGVSHYGERYDPIFNQWSPMAGSDSAPHKLNTNHRAVWTGAEWILWGRGNSGQPLRYEASSQTLRVGTATGAPPQMSGFTAVWADGAMLVWGGNPVFSEPGLVVAATNGGGAYCALVQGIFTNGFEG